MIVGTLKETKNREYRVALLPYGVDALVRGGHTVLVESGSGAGAGWTNQAYREAGGTLVDQPGEIYARAALICKVKEPMPWELDLLRPGQTLFTYIHSAGNRPLCDALLAHRVCGIAIEDVQLEDGGLPLLEPMSAIAGALVMLKGFELLQTLHGGSGLFPGGLAGVRPAGVVILGAGFVGRAALRVAYGLGAQVTILDIDADKLAQLQQQYPRVRTLLSSEANIRKALTEADVLLNAVVWPRTRSGHLVSREMLGLMPPGAVIVDVAADIGGALETSDRHTTHDDPTYLVDGHLHYVVPNIPSLVARSASQALSNATLPYILLMASLGPRRALIENQPLRRGLTCIDGAMVSPITAEWYGCDHLTEAQVIGLLEKGD